MDILRNVVANNGWVYESHSVSGVPMSLRLWLEGNSLVGKWSVTPSTEMKIRMGLYAGVDETRLEAAKRNWLGREEDAVFVLRCVGFPHRPGRDPNAPVGLGCADYMWDQPYDTVQSFHDWAVPILDGAPNFIDLNRLSSFRWTAEALSPENKRWVSDPNTMATVVTTYRSGNGNFMWWYGSSPHTVGRVDAHLEKVGDLISERKGWISDPLVDYLREKVAVS